jgi:protein involved in polysaccharide export with SLBB domain
VSVRLTVPVKPLTADTVIVEVAEVPTVTEAGEVAEIVKSVTVNVAVVL